MDAALGNKMVSLATSIDARCKRQAAAVAITEAAVVEMETALRAVADPQRDLVDESSGKTSGNSNDEKSADLNKRRR